MNYKLTEALKDHVKGLAKYPFRYHNHYRVLQEMIDHSDYEEHTFFVGQRTLAKNLDIGLSTVSRISKHLQHHGIIKKLNRKWKSGQRVHWHINKNMFSHVFETKPIKAKALSCLEIGALSSLEVNTVNSQKALSREGKSVVTGSPKRSHKPPNMNTELRTKYQKRENQNKTSVDNFSKPVDEINKLKDVIE